MIDNKMKSSICNCQNLRRAAMVVTKLYDDRLAAGGITACQYSLLKTLKAMGPCSVSDLARQIRLDRTTLVRNLKPLEASGLLSDISKTGARGHKLVLTDQGMNKCEETEPMWQEAQDAVTCQLGPENLAALTELLLAIEHLGLQQAGNWKKED